MNRSRPSIAQSQRPAPAYAFPPPRTLARIHRVHRIRHVTRETIRSLRIVPKNKFNLSGIAIGFGLPSVRSRKSANFCLHLKNAYNQLKCLSHLAQKSPRIRFCSPNGAQCDKNNKCEPSWSNRVQTPAVNKYWAIRGRLGVSAQSANLAFRNYSNLIGAERRFNPPAPGSQANCSGKLKLAQMTRRSLQAPKLNVIANWQKPAGTASTRVHQLDGPAGMFALSSLRARLAVLPLPAASRCHRRHCWRLVVHRLVSS